MTIRRPVVISAGRHTELPAGDTVHGLPDALQNTWRAGTSPFESWYMAGHSVGAVSSSNTLTANRIYAFPFRASESMTLDRMGVRVTTSAAGNLRLGIYALDGNNLPSSLTLDAGTVSVSSTGIKTATINQLLTPGLYAAVAVSDVAPTLGAAIAANQIHFYGEASDLSSAQPNGYASFTYDVLPSTFPSGITAASSNLFIFLRRSA